MLQNRIVKILKASRTPYAQQIAKAISTSFVAEDPSWKEILTFIAESFPQVRSVQSKKMHQTIARFSCNDAKPLLEFALFSRKQASHGETKSLTHRVD